MEIETVLADEHATLWTRFRALCARVSRAQGFELFNACTIMVNAIVLGLNWCASWRLYLLLTLYVQASSRQGFQHLFLVAIPARLTL
jgi:hypothetical protein